jgi:hypothetical protein
VEVDEDAVELIETNSKKLVKRLNLMLKHENPDMMETRRLTAHFFRCMHLLELGIAQFIQSGEGFHF